MLSCHARLEYVSTADLLDSPERIALRCVDAHSDSYAGETLVLFGQPHGGRRFAPVVDSLLHQMESRPVRLDIFVGVTNPAGAHENLLRLSSSSAMVLLRLSRMIEVTGTRRSASR